MLATNSVIAWARVTGGSVTETKPACGAVSSSSNVGQHSRVVVDHDAYVFVMLKIYDDMPQGSTTCQRNQAVHMNAERAFARSRPLHSL